MNPFCRTWRIAVLDLVALFLLCPSMHGDEQGAATTPAVEHATFRLADPSLQIELAAVEPQITSPVAIAWDAAGALFVAEMIDYPVASASGRIRKLEDRDRDRVYETATVFAEGLPFPNGVLPCHGGVLVTAAPDILYLRDNDGDGRADERKVVLTGFVPGNTQLRVNGLFWGLDNWIYAANGRSDGEVRTPGTPANQAISIRRRDLRFRFRPDGGQTEVQAIAGFSQFGLAHDDRGNRFPSWNTIPIRHVVLEQAALDRNPYLAETSSVAQILDEADGGRVYSISPIQARFNRESVDYFNASCGPTIFRGDRLPAAYQGNAFVCEPLTNLVHRRSLEPDGCTFRARRVEAGREFLASTDPAFRPVNLTTGPDGVLYVVDMYRELVEHPDFVPEKLRTKVDFRRWHDRGRIWRIHSRDAGEAHLTDQLHPALDSAGTQALVQALDHPVGWYRDTAQRLLVERQDRAAIPFLEQSFHSGTRPLGRLHALWTLQGLDAASRPLVESALGDGDAIIREQALRLILADRTLLRDIKRTLLLAAATDSSIRVRLQAAIVLGVVAVEDQGAVRGLVSIARRDGSDPWIRIAVLSSLGEAAVTFLQEWSSQSQGSPRTMSPGERRLLSEVASIVGVRRREPELSFVLELLAAPRPRVEGAETQPDEALALAAGLGEGLGRSGTPLHAWLAGLRGRDAKRAASLSRLWATARALLISNQPVERRRLALEALVRGAPELAGPVLPDLLRANQPPSIQAAAAEAVGQTASAKQVEAILESWGELSLGVRRTLLAAMTSNPTHGKRLIQAIEEQKVAVVELDAASREALLRIAEPELKRRLEGLLARFAPADRSAVVERYQEALKLPADRLRGEKVFEKNCQTCHERQGRGHHVGPELSGIAGRLPDVLLSDILHPNRDVAPDFVALSVETRNGQLFSGLLVEETATGVKLRQAEGVEQTILRSEIADLRSSGRSLMPEGLEQAISLQEMADLLAFLRSGTK